MKKIIFLLLILNNIAFAAIFEASNEDKNRLSNALNKIRNIDQVLIDEFINADLNDEKIFLQVWKDSKYRYVYQMITYDDSENKKPIAIFLITEIYNLEHSFIKNFHIKDGTIFLFNMNNTKILKWSNVFIINHNTFNLNNINSIDITTFGEKITNNLDFFIEDCNKENNKNFSVEGFRKTTSFQCTPGFTGGYKLGLVIDGDTNEILNKFNIFVNDNSDSNYDYLHGIDVSHHQGTIDWSLMQNDDNVKFAFIKATEGYGSSASSEDTLIKNYIVSSKFRENIDNAINNNIFSGLYHFIRPDLNPGLQGAENEAKTFVRFAKFYYDTYEMLPPVVDVENPPCKEPCPNYKTLKELFSANTLSLWVKKWLEVVESEMGIRPIVYTYGGYNSYLVGLDNYDLWVARYPYSDGDFRPLNEHDEQYKPTDANWANATTPWTDWVMWQYTSAGGQYVDGIAGDGLDRNVYRGTLNALKHWSSSKRHKQSLQN